MTPTQTIASALRSAPPHSFVRIDRKTADATAEAPQRYPDAMAEAVHLIASEGVALGPIIRHAEVAEVKRFATSTLKLEDLTGSLRLLSEIPQEEGFRVTVVLYERNREIAAFMAKDDAGKLRLKSAETDAWLISPKGIVWNAIKGWRAAK